MKYYCIAVTKVVQKFENVVFAMQYIDGVKVLGKYINMHKKYLYVLRDNYVARIYGDLTV